MTAFHVAQLGLAAAALGIIAWRGRLLVRQSAIDSGAFASALRGELDAGHHARAIATAAALQPAAAAELAQAALLALQAGEDAHDVLDETHVAMRHRLSRGRDEVVVLGRMATPLALIGVIVELSEALGSRPELLLWERTLAWGAMLSNSTLTFSIGVSTLIVCAVGAAWMKRRAHAVVRDLERVAASFEMCEIQRARRAM